MFFVWIKFIDFILLVKENLNKTEYFFVDVNIFYQITAVSVLETTVLDVKLKS